MQERDHYLSQQYHQHLLEIAASERLAHSAGSRSPSRLDHLMEQSGDLLISLGQRLKNHALKDQVSTPDLSGECA
jgi:hypothetical protein